MKSLKMLSQLNIANGNLITSLRDKSNSVFLQQGSVDGACGPYCVFMALIILGIISYDDATNLWWTKRSTRFGKMLAKMQEHDTLFQNGTHLYQLQELLEVSFKKTLVTKVSPERGRNLIQFIQDELDKDCPVIFGVTGQKLAHWLLATGYEADDEGSVIKITFLDPSGNPSWNYYNGVLDVEFVYKGRYPYAWVSCEDDIKVSLEEGISMGVK